MLIKTIMKYHLTLIRTTSDSLQIINAGEGVQKREPSYTVSGNVNCVLPVENSKYAQSCPTLCNPVDVAHQAPLSIGSHRQEYWRELPVPPLCIFLTQGWNLSLLHWQADSLSMSH